MRNSSIDYQLSFGYNAINNALDNQSVKNALAEYGYDEAKLREGIKVYEKANACYLDQLREYGEQFAATDQVNEARKKLHSIYVKHLKIARILFRQERGIYQELQMAGKRHVTHTGYLSQVEAFYSNGIKNKAFLKGMAGYNISKEKLQEGFGLFKVMKTKYLSQLKEMGEAQQATEKKNEAIDALIDWLSDFTAISRIALEDNPQELEILGIRVK